MTGDSRRRGLSFADLDGEFTTEGRTLSVVGPKGEVVIEKEIRERLGVQPGWQALQLLVGEHVEVYFLSPPHNRSLAGCLAPYVTGPASVEDEELWDAAVGSAIAEEFRAGPLA